jgi:pimeloyl-ACP methyl ester carboxylesterase
MILHAIEAGPPAAPPVVLLHGLFGQARNFGAVQRALAARFRVIALDARNHGDSPHAAGMDYPTMAADVLETLQARGALPCALIGHSMGGKTAMRVALDSPDALTRLLVADIAPVSYPSHHGAYVAAMAALPLTPGLTRAAADAALSAAIPDTLMRGFLLQNLRPGAAPAWRNGLAEIAASLPALESWPESDAAPWPGPALFVRGERSDYVPPDVRPAIRARFPAARFVTIKQAGHLVHTDAPAVFLALVESFLR